MCCDRALQPLNCVATLDTHGKGLVNNTIHLWIAQAKQEGRVKVLANTQQITDLDLPSAPAVEASLAHAPTEVGQKSNFTKFTETH